MRLWYNQVTDQPPTFPIFQFSQTATRSPETGLGLSSPGRQRENGAINGAGQCAAREEGYGACRARK